MIMEVVRGFCEGYYHELIDRPVTIKEGRAWFDFGPGLGVKLRPEVLSRPDVRVRAPSLNRLRDVMVANYEAQQR